MVGLEWALSDNLNCNSSRRIGDSQSIRNKNENAWSSDTDNIRESTFKSREECEGGNHVKAYPKFLITWVKALRSRDFGRLSNSSIMRFWSIRIIKDGAKSRIQIESRPKSPLRRVLSHMIKNFGEKVSGPKSWRHAFAFTWLPLSHSFLDPKMDPK